jgi:hypothetical protein
MHPIKRKTDLALATRNPNRKGETEAETMKPKAQILI